MNSRRITLIVAVVLALVTGVLTLRFLSSVNQKTQAAAVVMAPLIVASVEIPARTKIKPQMLTKVQRPQTSIEPGSFAEAKDVEGDTALSDIPAGTPLNTSKVGVPAAIGVTGQLMPGQRAVSIPVDSVKSVSGLVSPGDRVDVLASKDGSEGGSGKHPQTKAIIRGALVLAVNSTIQAAANASPPPAGAAPPDANGATTVTLAVSPSQADLLTVADLNSTLRLALRSPDESPKSLPPEHMDFDVAAPPTQAPAPAAAASAAPAPAHPVPATPGIVVIDGDQVETGAK